MRVLILLTFIFGFTAANAIPWATNDKSDPAGKNEKIGKRNKPKLEKHEAHCYNQIENLSFIGKSYDVKKVAQKKMSDQATISYYEVREFNRGPEGVKVLARKRMYSCMYGLNPFDNNKPHKRKLLNKDGLPPGVEKL